MIRKDPNRVFLPCSIPSNFVTSTVIAQSSVIGFRLMIFTYFSERAQSGSGEDSEHSAIPVQIRVCRLHAVILSLRQGRT